MRTYGLYVYRCPYPVATGTRRECLARVNDLTPAQLQRGWTVGPVAECSARFPEPRSNPLWALAGFTLVAGVLAIVAFALKGILH